MPEECPRITGLLTQWRAGDKLAGDRVMEILYTELREMASREMRREPGGHTLQTTALVHEMYLRLIGTEPITWQDRGHFFAVAAQVLRHILVDHARRARSEKRGGPHAALLLQEYDAWVMQPDETFLALEEGLAKLETLDERAARIVELRFFGGLSEKETAEALNISVATVKRDWGFARTWLASQLR